TALCYAGRPGAARPARRHRRGGGARLLAGASWRWPGASAGAVIHARSSRHPKGSLRMSAPPKSRGEAITSKRQLVEYLEQGCKPREQWRIGTEHEKFAFDLATLRRLPYEGPRGIQALLKGMQRFGWQPVEEDGNVIALG